MKNNSNGFSMLEVMAALAVVALMTTVAVPVLIRIYEERLAIREEQEALEMLHNEIHRWAISGTAPNEAEKSVVRQGRTYSLTWDTGSTKVCISWTASNERGYKKCGYVDLPADTP